jgi:hypothetical protein
MIVHGALLAVVMEKQRRQSDQRQYADRQMLRFGPVPFVLARAFAAKLLAQSLAQCVTAGAPFGPHLVPLALLLAPLPPGLGAIAVAVFVLRLRFRWIGRRALVEREILADAYADFAHATLLWGSDDAYIINISSKVKGLNFAI